MTQDEFQKKYHNYQTFHEVEAQAEAAKANTEGIEDNEAVAVQLGKLGWCLMLKSAADFAKEIGVI